RLPHPRRQESQQCRRAVAFSGMARTWHRVRRRDRPRPGLGRGLRSRAGAAVGAGHSPRRLRQRGSRARRRVHPDQHPDGTARPLHELRRHGERVLTLLRQTGLGHRCGGAFRRVGRPRGSNRMIQDLVVAIVFISYAIGVLMTFGLVLTWVERKQGAVMSDRIGANRAYVRIPFTQVKLVWWGLFHGLADGLKMLLKEDWKPNSYDRLAYAIAPWVTFAPVLLVFAVIPFGGTFRPAVLFEGMPTIAAWFGD